jgi:tetratricopeptide (TPR) repeat protein
MHGWRGPAAAGFIERCRRSERSLEEAIRMDENATVTTPQVVRSLWDKSIALYERREFDAAAASLEVYAEKANELANLLSATLQPYYGANSHEEESSGLSRKAMERLSQVETSANELKAQRNLAYVLIGESHEQLGDLPQALASFTRALQVISLGRRDAEAWERAREGILRITRFAG